MSLLNELKRRNVIRVAIAYLAASWLITEVAGTVLPAFGYGDSELRIIITILVIALIPVLIFSWAFEITPEGLKREVDVHREHSITRFTGKKIDRIIMVLLALGMGYFAFDKFVLDPVEDVQIAESAHQEGRTEAINDSYGDKSIAVLPFVNMSSDLEQEYFSDGLTDTLIHGLAQVSGLRVTAKTSSFYFKGMNVDSREIARKLNVSNILEGSVQKSGNRVRIIAQLIEANSDTHLWSKNFDRELEDIFAIQDDIAREVVRALEVTLLDTEKERLAQRYQPKLEAYEQLILGRYEMAKLTADSLVLAEQYFKQAIELDPDYALPYVDLSFTLGMQVVHGSLVFEESLQRKQPLVDKALELDPLSGEAHIARADFLRSLRFKTAEGNYNAEKEEILKAIELSPNYAYARLSYSGLLYGQGQHEEALEQIRLAAELDPMSPIIQTSIAQTTWNIGRTEEAMEQLHRNIERNPEFPSNYSLMARYQARLGHLGESLRWRQEARRRNPENGFQWVRVCRLFLSLGDVFSAEDCVKQLSEAHPEKFVTSGAWLTLHWYRGEWDVAIAVLESLLERVRDEPWVGEHAYLIARRGDVKRARQLMANAFPDLLEDELELDSLKSLLAVTFAAILNANDETEQRDVLLAAMEERIATMHRIRSEGYGILDVYVHALRGDRKRAIAALREAIDMGWRVTIPGYIENSWWMLRQDWRLVSLHDDPEFIAMMDELEADVAAQRQWYEENKDKPLF